MIQKLKHKIKTNLVNGIFHDSRADVNALAEYCEVITKKINELVDAVNNKSTPKCEKGCEYCDFSSGDVGARMNTSGDDFVMIKSECDVDLACDDRHFRILKINFCPICGRSFEKDGDPDADKT